MPAYVKLLRHWRMYWRPSQNQPGQGPSRRLGLLVKYGQIRCNYNILVHASWQEAVGKGRGKSRTNEGGKMRVKEKETVERKGK